MRTLWLGAALAVALSLSACTDTIYMRNAATGEVATCGPYSNVGLYMITSGRRERECIESFERAGYLRTAAPR